MPLLLSRHPFPDSTFGIWQIAEAEEFFRSGLPLSPDESAEFERLKGIRRLEWLAARWLLHHLSGQDIRLPLAKDAFSKPFFPDHAHFACSLSHSHGVVGAVLRSPPQPPQKGGWGGLGLGCDIQLMVEKMTRLAPKFLNVPEADFVAKHSAERQFDLVHIFWTAKESLYKAYGLKALDFREHMYVEPFIWDGQRGESTGWVVKPEFRQAYRLWFEKMELPDGQYLVWTVCSPV